MQLTKRDGSWLTGRKDLEELYCFPDFPVHMMAEPGSAEADDLKLDMKFCISRESGSVQLESLVPEEALYKDAHFQTSHSKVWQTHNEELAVEIAGLGVHSILEIGGGTGILSEIYRKIVGGGERVKWYIVEPNPEPVEGCKAIFIKGFFPKDRAKLEELPFDCIVHSNTWEHMYDPVGFLSELAKIMKNGTYMVFSVPDFKGQLENHFTSMMNFEHNIYLDEGAVEFLLHTYGMRIKLKKRFGIHHSIFYVVQSIGGTQGDGLIEDQAYEKNKKAFLDFFQYNKNLVNRWNEQIADLKREMPGRRVYLFGAHITSQYFLAYGLRRENIITILDNNPHKQGKRISGTGWIAESPKILAQDKNPAVILPQSPYKDEIKKDILSNINDTAIFLDEL